MVLSGVARIETEWVEMLLISFWQITKAVAAIFNKSPGPGILRLVLGPHLSTTNLRTRVALSPPSLNIFNAGPFCFRAETMDDSAALQSSAGQTYGRRICWCLISVFFDRLHCTSCVGSGHTFLLISMYKVREV